MPCQDVHAMQPNSTKACPAQYTVTHTRHLRHSITRNHSMAERATAGPDTLQYPPQPTTPKPQLSNKAPTTSPKQSPIFAHMAHTQSHTHSHAHTAYMPRGLSSPCSSRGAAQDRATQLRLAPAAPATQGKHTMPMPNARVCMQCSHSTLMHTVPYTSTAYTR